MRPSWSYPGVVSARHRGRSPNGQCMVVILIGGGGLGKKKKDTGMGDGNGKLVDGCEMVDCWWK